MIWILIYKFVTNIKELNRIQNIYLQKQIMHKMSLVIFR